MSYHLSSWHCRGCGISLFFAGFPSDSVCCECRITERETGTFSAAAKQSYKRRARDAYKHGERQRRTMLFRDGRRGADGVPSSRDWNY